MLTVLGSIVYASIQSSSCRDAGNASDSEAGSGLLLRKPEEAKRNIPFGIFN